MQSGARRNYVCLSVCRNTCVLLNTKTHHNQSSHAKQSAGCCLACHQQHLTTSFLYPPHVCLFKSRCEFQNIHRIMHCCHSTVCSNTCVTSTRLICLPHRRLSTLPFGSFNVAACTLQQPCPKHTWCSFFLSRKANFGTDSLNMW
jgi:hypothetical protein